MYITFVHVLHAAVIIIDNYDRLVALPLMPVCLLVQKKTFYSFCSVIFLLSMRKDMQIDERIDTSLMCVTLTT